MVFFKKIPVPSILFHLNMSNGYVISLKECRGHLIVTIAIGIDFKQYEYLNIVRSLFTGYKQNLR